MKDKLELQKELKQKELTLIEQLNEIYYSIERYKTQYEDLELDYKQVKEQLENLNQTITEYNNKECREKVEKLYRKYVENYANGMLAIPEYDILTGVKEEDFLQAKQKIFDLMKEYNKKYIRVWYKKLCGMEFTIRDELD